MGNMGFLQFLKKDKKAQQIDELDLPPVPPSIDGMDMPPVDDLKDMPMPTLDKDMADVSFPDIDKDMPNFDDFKFDEAPMPEIPEPVQEPAPDELGDIGPITAPKEEYMPPAPQEETPPAEVEEPQEEPMMAVQQARQAQQDILQPKEIAPKISAPKMAPSSDKKSVYVKLDDFKRVFAQINSVRSDFRKSDEALVKIEGIKSSKDKSFENLKLNFHELQKRLIFVDKTIFKGE